MTFQPGQSGNPSGKPKGTKNKNFMSCQYWYTLIAENAHKMPADKKITIAFQALNLLMPKVQTLPAEPGDSVANVQETLEMLKKMEAQTIPSENGDVSSSAS